MTAPTSLDRLMVALRTIIRAEVPELTYLGVYEYALQRVRGNVVDAAPTTSTLSLPSIIGLALSPSTLGEAVDTPAVGQRILIRFANGSPTRPEVCGIFGPSRTATVDASDAITFGDPSTTSVQIAGGTAPVGRVGDAIQVFLPLTPVPVSGVMSAIFNFNGFLTFAASGTGIVVAGNPKVVA
jgi:hypothetical protein